MRQNGLLGQLIESLRCLPGVGPKSAQRMTFHLLQRDREGARALGRVLLEAVEKIGHCERCRTLSEQKLCRICASPSRDTALLCIVESPADVLAVDQAAAYKGLYFVLHGRLSPLDGIGPEELGLDILSSRFGEGEIKELILATNTTVEGEATAHYIAEMARQHPIRTTRIAHGVPLGGELEYIDSGTLSHAFSGRKEF
ncbi:MAG: recombination mediator RecR [Pseudomonadota bacterium]